MPVPHRYVATNGTVTYKVRVRAHGRNTSETFGTKAEAIAFCRMVKHVGAESAVAEREHEVLGETLDEVAEAFFEWKAGRVRSDRTVADYRRDYTNWIQPRLGWRHIDTITENDVANLVETMAAQLSPKSVADRHAILFGIFSYATSPARKYVARNPCIGTDLPKRRKSQPKGLRPAEWQALYAALVQIDPDAADLAEFMLATGWRVSEAAALSAYEVEDDETDVYVNMGRVLRRNAAGQHVIVEDAKSEAGIRRVKLDPQAGEMVRRRVERVRADGLVFTTSRGNQWHYANFLNRFWKPAVKAAGLTREPTPHWLRHTAVFWLVLGRKTSLAEIQRRIGHENIATTIDVYGRMVDDVSDEALAAFAALRIGPASTQPVTGRDAPGGAGEAGIPRPRSLGPSAD